MVRKALSAPTRGLFCFSACRTVLVAVLGFVVLTFLHLKEVTMGFYSNLDIEVRQAVKEIMEQNNDSYWVELCTKYPTILDRNDFAKFVEKA